MTFINRFAVARFCNDKLMFFYNVKHKNVFEVKTYLGSISNISLWELKCYIIFSRRNDKCGDFRKTFFWFEKIEYFKHFWAVERFNIHYVSDWRPEDLKYACQRGRPELSLKHDEFGMLSTFFINRIKQITNASSLTLNLVSRKWGKQRVS